MVGGVELAGGCLASEGGWDGLPQPSGSGAEELWALNGFTSSEHQRILNVTVSLALMLLLTGREPVWSSS